MSVELPLAVVSLAFQAFAGCVQGYELIADACRLEKDAERLLVNFKIEEFRLLNWAKLVNLDYTDERLTLNQMSRGLIIDVLDQQQKLLASFGRLNKTYRGIRNPLLSETTQQFTINSDYLLENGASTAEGSDRTVQFPAVEEIAIKAINWLKSSRTVPKRLKWATWDHKKMEGLIKELSTFNDRMDGFLDRNQMENLMEMQTRTNYQIVLLNKHLDNMVQIFQSGRLAYHPPGMITELEDSEWDFSSDSIMGLPHRALTHQRLDTLAQQKFVHLAIEDAEEVTEENCTSIDLPHLANKNNISGPELNCADITPKSGNWFPEEIEEGDRTEATYKGSSVWIEWKPNETAGPGQPDGQVDPKIRSRVTKLAALLQHNNRLVNFRAPHCLGYFVDDGDDRESRFGLIFEKPAHVPSNVEPTTLRSLIEHSQGDDATVEMPSLTDRITLMRLLADTVERLHAVDWLHKGLRSSNILFFAIPSNGDEGPTINYADPYVSGFDYSRPATSDDLTERPTDNAWADIYRHPTVQSTGNREESSQGRESYKKSYDLYSLGIVLLEIAHWKTIDQILGIDLATARPKQTWPVKDRLLTKEPRHLKFVRSHLGNTVEKVVRLCLEGPEGFGLSGDEKRDVVAVSLQRAFGEQVVRRLGAMRL